MTAPGLTLASPARRRDTTRSGVIEGEIAWRADSGAPMGRDGGHAGPGRLRLPRRRHSADPAHRPDREHRRHRPQRLDQREQQPLAQLAATVASSSTPDAVAQAVVADTAARAPLATAATLQVQRPFSEASVWDSAGPAPVPPPGTAPLGVGAAELVQTLGSRVAYEEVMDLFRRGPVQFEVGCTNASGMPSGSTTIMWWDDDEGGWSRRRYRVEGVETDTPLSVSCRLAQDWVWRGGTVRAVEPVN